MKAFFSKPGKSSDSRRNFSMGAASSAFEDSNLDFQTTMAIKIICDIFKPLDRQAISAMEISLNISAPHRRNVRRLVAEASESNLSLRERLKPLKGKDHNTVYGIFIKICQIASNSGRYNESFLNNLKNAGKEMTLSKDEICRLVERYGLAE